MTNATQVCALHSASARPTAINLHAIQHSKTILFLAKRKALSMSGTDNFLGFLALLVYSATLLPSNLKVAFPQFTATRTYKFLLKNRREAGVLTFAISALHACVAVYQQSAGKPMTVDILRQSISGLLILTIFAALALTSNNWSIAKLKRNWKRLHSMTYVAAVLLPWHISAKMTGKGTLLTIVSTIISVELVALWVFRQHKKRLNSISKTG